MNTVPVRPLEPGDSLERLTALLHRACGSLARRSPNGASSGANVSSRCWRARSWARSRWSPPAGGSAARCSTRPNAATYERRGYRVVDRVDWKVTNYVSVIMAKAIGGR